MTQPSKQLVIGIGTGRCGTLSLARLLDRQPGLSVTHEGPPVLPWSVDQTLFEQKLAVLMSQSGPMAGDVSSSWLPYIPLLLERHEQVRVICLQRNRLDTITSFKRKMKGKYNHWMDHGGSRWRLNPRWDPCFPKYAADNMEDAIGRYWDEYRDKVETLQTRFPTRVRSWPVEETLNTAMGVGALLEFAGIPADRQVSLTGIRENRGRPQQRGLTQRLRQWLSL